MKNKILGFMTLAIMLIGVSAQSQNVLSVRVMGDSVILSTVTQVSPGVGDFEESVYKKWICKDPKIKRVIQSSTIDFARNPGLLKMWDWGRVSHKYRILYINNKVLTTHILLKGNEIIGYSNPKIPKQIGTLEIKGLHFVSNLSPVLEITMWDDGYFNPQNFVGSFSASGDIYWSLDYDEYHVAIRKQDRSSTLTSGLYEYEYNLKKYKVTFTIKKT
jgi:hypothetical protein